MDTKKLDFPNKGSNDPANGEQNPNIDPELETCISIFLKHHSVRTEEEVEIFAAKIASLQVFGRSLLENLEPKTVIAKLMPYMKYEYFPAGKPIFNYEQPSDKMYILLRGRAKEFVPKSIDEIEKESHNKYGGGFLQSSQTGSTIPSLPDLQKVETPTSTTSSVQWGTKALHASLNTISEEDVSEGGGTSDATKKRFRKLKAVLPFLQKMNTEKTRVQNAEEYMYKKTIKKVRSILKPILSDEDINLEVLERELGSSVVEEFVKYSRNYFIGGILKVRFSKFLLPGSHCGIRALRDNSLRSRAVFAEDNCYCLSLHRDHFAAVIENEKALNSDKIEFFKKMFNMFDERSVVEFSLLWENQTCKLNDVIFQQNEASNHLYVLSTGEVMFTKAMEGSHKPKQFFSMDLPFRLKKKVNPNPNENTVRVATISSGDFFGEEDFFEERPRELNAIVMSNKARMYRLSHHKYKTRGKNYSEIIKEIKRLMSLKTNWKKERLKDLYEQHSQTLQVNNTTQDFLKEQEKNLIGLLSPQSSSQQQSSQRLKLKVMEKAKAITSELSEQNELPKPPSGKIKENPKVVDFRYIVNPKRNSLKPNDHISSGKPLEAEEFNIFARTRIPRHYDQKQEDLVKKDNSEIVRLDFRDSTKRASSQRADLRSRDESKRSNSQLRDVSSLSTASIMLIKKKYMKKKTRVADSGMEIKEYRDINQRAPSLNLDTRLQSQENQSQTITINAIQSLTSLTDKHFKQYIKGSSIQSPSNQERCYISSLGQLDKPEKDSMTNVDASTRQTLTKTIHEIGSLNRITDEMAVSKSVTLLSPIHARPKTRSSAKLLRSTLQRRESWKMVNNTESYIQNSGDQLIHSQKSFRILGERAKTRGLPGTHVNRPLKNVGLTAAFFAGNQSQLEKS